MFLYIERTKLSVINNFFVHVHIEPKVLVYITRLFEAIDKMNFFMFSIVLCDKCTRLLHFLFFAIKYICISANLYKKACQKIHFIFFNIIILVFKLTIRASGLLVRLSYIEMTLITNSIACSGPFYSLTKPIVLQSICNTRNIFFFFLQHDVRVYRPCLLQHIMLLLFFVT